MTTALTPRPCPWTKSILAEFADIVRTYNVAGPVLDPFAGGGTLELAEAVGLEVQGVELEAEWAAQTPNTIQGDARHLPVDWTGRFGAVITSPPYANRMADQLVRSFKESRTYATALQRRCSDGSLAALQWSGPQGEQYRHDATRALLEAKRVVDPHHGFIVWNVKNHYRGDELQNVVEWYVEQFGKMAFTSSTETVGLVEVREVPVRGYRYGANAEKRVQSEAVIIWQSHTRRQ